MTNYRKIWEDNNGPIPYDVLGRRMEIHHIDGNRKNSSIENLQLLTIIEHYDIHHKQGDWGACQSIINRMKVSPEEKSRICSELANKRIREGTHPFQDPVFIKKDSERKSLNRRGKNHPLYGKKMSKETTDKQSASQKKLVEKGIHYLQSDEHRNKMRLRAIDELSRGSHIFQSPSTREKINITHSKLLQAGKHPFNSINRVDPNKIMVFCAHCQKEVTKPAYGRFHKH